MANRGFDSKSCLRVVLKYLAGAAEQARSGDPTSEKVLTIYMLLEKLDNVLAGLRESFSSLYMYHSKS